MGTNVKKIVKEYLYNPFISNDGKFKERTVIYYIMRVYLVSAIALGGVLCKYQELSALIIAALCFLTASFCYIELVASTKSDQE